MIDSLNSSGLNGLGADLAPLAKQIARRADADRDGTVSGAEFTSFLNGVLQSAADAAPASIKDRRASLEQLVNTLSVTERDLRQALPAVRVAFPDATLDSLGALDIPALGRLLPGSLPGTWAWEPSR